MEWENLEKEFLACIGERHDLRRGTEILNQLSARFGPESARVGRLVGMLSEASGKWAAAANVYAGILEKNPCNLLVMKRKVAALRSQGKVAEAISELNTVLETFQGDEGAWNELLDLHEGIGNMEAAAFCAEELILIAPGSHVYHTRCAELYCSLKQPKLVEARKHLAQALVLAPRYPRALHCLAGVCFAIATQSGKASRSMDAAETEVTASMWEFARDELTKAYAEASAPTRDAVHRLLEQQAAAFPDAA